MDIYKDNEKLLDATAVSVDNTTHGNVHQEMPELRPQRESTCHRLIARFFKSISILAAALLVLTALSYMGSETFYDMIPDWFEHDCGGDMADDVPSDCRGSGCHSGYTCAPVNANIACFIAPCPSVLFDCVPAAMVDKPDATEFFVQPILASNSPAMTMSNPTADSRNPEESDMKGKLTDPFLACTQKHGNMRSWSHVDGCNTCVCTLQGTVACTKKLCLLKPQHSFKEAVSEAMNQGPEVHTTVMVPLDNANPSDDTHQSAIYTSVPVDVQA
ncbi:hypothetical protein COEREDRAFT_79211 [Coemansia reversa NRRL 1564]|uniref:Pacifastin domain-containing protein n=1 Tax=Coemansia reversa (strain ATCC 12441 / NRRL 1564) TaxID=763665 RepID=A0A2G5BJP5_COERN|nr:hypothetical protein COEREDRAFT_79211 [Coemansia reversa NRRL 1564]|eukprot:PIA19254.1 hypothetical protein COEREDRAFT_79211 [Coemansia reversa NRRL 1564]